MQVVSAVATAVDDVVAVAAAVAASVEGAYAAEGEAGMTMKDGVLTTAQVAT